MTLSELPVVIPLGFGVIKVPNGLLQISQTFQFLSTRLPEVSSIGIVTAMSVAEARIVIIYAFD